jgi:hypothetical protein
MTSAADAVGVKWLKELPGAFETRLQGKRTLASTFKPDERPSRLCRGQGFDSPRLQVAVLIDLILRVHAVDCPGAFLSSVP